MIIGEIVSAVSACRLLSSGHDHANRHPARRTHLPNHRGRDRDSPATWPGLLESAYLACLIRELTGAGLPFETQRPIPLVYKGATADCAYRADLIVDRCVLVEVKAMEALAQIHVQQVYTYLRLGNYPVGLLLNFGAKTMKEGLKRILNGYPNQ